MEDPRIREIRAVLDEADRDNQLGNGGLPLDQLPAPALYFDRIRAIVDSAPLPDSETEWQWGCRDRHGQVHSVGVENEPQARAMLSMTPVRRAVGPWIEVPRG